MNRPLMTRRALLHLGVKAAACATLGAGLLRGGERPQTDRAASTEFDVHEFGATGDGVTPDTKALQKAIDEAAARGAGSRVLLRGGKRYLSGQLRLRSGVDFHLADDAELLVSTREQDYGPEGAAITAEGAEGLRLTGTGSINGRSPEFMVRYDEADEWWRPKSFRPRLVLLTGCRNVEVRDLQMRQAPFWTLHMLGCEKVLVDGLRIDNQLDVPNCDGIDPDHCRDVEIRNCRISCGDDAIVVKATRQLKDFGPSANIVVKDCVLQTQDSGLKIGTETTQDIHDIRFERCKIVSGSRGLCIQLRDEGSVYGVEFSDIELVSRRHSAPWWGMGEPISLTAIPRMKGTAIGRIHDVRFRNVTGRAENSLRIDGSLESRIRDVRLENVALTLGRWTKYPGALFDNRPTKAYPDREAHGTPGIFIRHADRVVLDRCRIFWGDKVPDSFTHALQAEDVTGLEYPGFDSPSAHPGKVPPVAIN